MLKGLAIMEESDWDSRILGRKIGRLSLYVPRPDASIDSLLQNVCLAAESMGFEALFGRVDMEQIRTLQVVLRNGALLGGALITLGKNLRREETIPRLSTIPRSDLTFTDAKADDGAELEKITSMAYTLSHYHNDPNIPWGRAEMIYQEWIKNSLHGFADIVLVARLNQEIVGYATVQLKTISDKAYACIDLLTTKESLRGRRIGSSLVLEAIKRTVDKTDTVIVGTQVSNLPALRLYQRLMFMPIMIEGTFHIWLKTRAR
jgi:ribosomal protein S18 acetylase RimI-like enzyme